MSDLEPTRGAVVLAVDLGGTRLRAALVDASGAILADERVASPRGGPAAILAAVVRLAEEVDPDARAALCGVAAPGPLDPRTGIVHTTPNIDGFDSYPLRELWSNGLRRAVWVHNDANLAALGEHRFGAGRGHDPLVYLTISTGVGGGVILDGRMLEGATGLGGELGHVIVAWGGPRCNLGHPGCLEAVASGTAIAKIASRGAAELDIKPDSEGISAEAVADAARGGNRAAQAIYDEVGTHLGAAIGGLINVFDPSRVVLGGGVTHAWDLFEASMRAAAGTVVMAADRRAVDIVLAERGDDSGLLGAAAYAFDHLQGTSGGGG